MIDGHIGVVRLPLMVPVGDYLLMIRTLSYVIRNTILVHCTAWACRCGRYRAEHHLSDDLGIAIVVQVGVLMCMCIYVR